MSLSSPEGHSNKMMDKDPGWPPSPHPVVLALGPLDTCVYRDACPERKGLSLYSPFELGTTPHPGLGQKGWRTGAQFKP